jgi:hypothetical protein
MKNLIALIAGASALLAQPAPTVARLFDQPLTGAERQIVGLAEAMPADKYNFAPKDGAFDTVRTFGEQIRHVATVNLMCAAAVLGQPKPEEGKNENGPDSNRTKEQIVKYLKDSFTEAHKAAQSMTAENQLQMIQSPFGTNQVTRGYVAGVPAWHTFDHYGQMVVYARMNKVIPPASQPAPPPPGTKKK